MEIDNSRPNISDASIQFLKKLFEISEGDQTYFANMWKIGQELGFSNTLISKIGQYLEAEDWIIFRSSEDDISITHKGIKTAEKEMTSRNNNKQQKENNNIADPRKVFVVHGRNEKARKAMFDFLYSIGLKPLEWGEALLLTKDASPFPQQVLDKALEVAQAIIILITGDDIARLRDRFIKDSDPEYERKLTIQARPNVIFETGLAFGRNPKRTVLVELEKETTRPFTDALGRLSIRISNSPKARKSLIDRLELAGCEINLQGKQEWLDAGDFDGAFIKLDKNIGKSRDKLKKKKQKNYKSHYFDILEIIAGQHDLMFNELEVFAICKDNNLPRSAVQIMKARLEIDHMIEIPDSGYGQLKWQVTKSGLLALAAFKKLF